MRKINVKLFLHELKKTFLLPLIFVFSSVPVLAFLIFMRAQFTDIFRFDSRFHHYNILTTIEKCILYAFFITLLIVFVCRTVKMRKLYEKVNISAVKLFLTRIVLIFSYCFLFVSFLSLIGTLCIKFFQSMEDVWTLSFNFEIGDVLNEFVKTEPFTFMGKSQWYVFLFGVSIGLCASIVYSVAVFIQNLITERQVWWLKIVNIVSLSAILQSTYYVTLKSYSLQSISGKSFFATANPIGLIDYNVYAKYFKTFIHYSSEKSLIVDLLTCYVCWNVTNIYTLLIGLFIILFVCFSILFLNSNKNISYASNYFKGIKK